MGHPEYENPVMRICGIDIDYPGALLKQLLLKRLIFYHF